MGEKTVCQLLIGLKNTVFGGAFVATGLKAIYKNTLQS
jgi:hypothetical protein